MNKKILIISNISDIHADIVATKATQRGGEVFRLDLDAFPGNFHIHLSLSGQEWDGGVENRSTGETLRLSEIGAVWVRKKAPFTYSDADFGLQEKAFADEEMNHLLFGALHSLDCYWMSHPAAMRGAMWKIDQLTRAARLGFSVPATIISNRPDAVRAFRSEVASDIIYKPLSSSLLGSDQVAPENRIAGAIHTTLVTPEHDEMIDSVSVLPSPFQRYVEKDHEVRVTIVDDRVFAARIDSQSDPRTKIDYRDFSVETDYRETRLPADIERKCLSYVKNYGLNYGAIDLIARPDGSYVFLENNPGGQFMFVEQLIPHIGISDHVAACLLRGAANAPARQ
jgi:glutathione synthase/RimK-type ligase-like ATP-grasp enzyme